MLDMSTFAAALKIRYSSDAVQNMVNEENPLLALLPRDTSVGGKAYTFDLVWANNQNRSATFATAQAQDTNHKNAAFTVSYTKNYATARIDGLLIEASKGDANAFFEAATAEIDSAISQMKNDFGSAVYLDGTGTIGQVGAITGAVITLKDVNTVVRFEVGMQPKFSLTSGAAPKTDAPTIVAVNRDIGTITLSAAGTVAVNDSISLAGDLNAKLLGLAAWLPATAPTSGENFQGVDRSVDATRMAGIRFDGSSLSKENALIQASFRAGREGVSPSTVVMNPSDYAALVTELGSKVHYYEHKVGEMGFQALKVFGPKGTLSVMSDRNCPGGVAYMLDLSAWKILSVGGELVRIDDIDGLKQLRLASADAIEIRVKAYSQMICKAPGRNVRITLAP